MRRNPLLHLGTNTPGVNWPEAKRGQSPLTYFVVQVTPAAGIVSPCHVTGSGP
jgi:hypothetical protein